jgi:hypothetical protein
VVDPGCDAIAVDLYLMDASVTFRGAAIAAGVVGESCRI